MNFNKKDTAIVLVDPQNEFLHEMGAGYPLAKDVLEENNTIKNIEDLLKASKENGYKVFVSPHYYYPHDHKWEFESKGEKMMHSLKMFERKGPSEAVDKNSRADIYELFKPYIEDDETVIASPHKIFGPQTNDLVLQLRKQKIDKVILGGMNSNICIESHMRDLVEQGFEVYIAKDATGAPGVDAYKAAEINFDMLSSGSLKTNDIIRNLR
ncbi:cysteine hydrolase [Clostridium massiliamazoniense]|uniref:cysteine hydrolase n=1 Tax=Clostridium massiliamazoniense TaxID=1347366 RepID=UPI0006D7CCA1|nr:cysteine hydrolase [Clostridium massiliamazoniense]